MFEKSYKLTCMDDLLANIDRYLEQTGMSPTTFGKKVMGNPAFVFEKRKGAGFNSATYKKIKAYIASNPPPEKPDQPSNNKENAA